MVWVIGGIVLLAVVALAAGLLLRPRPSVVEERLGRYAEVGVAAPTPAAAPKERASPLGDRLNKALQGRGFAVGIATDLARADLKFTVGEYVALMILCALGMALLGMVATSVPPCTGGEAGLLVCLMTRSYTGSMFLAAGAGLFGLFIPRIYVRVQQGGRLKRFEGQIGDTLNLLVNSLRAGYSVLQAMEAVSREQPPPISSEFRRVVQEMQLGLTMEAALDNLLRRIPSPDLDLVVTAINVQREVGGNLADILEVISHTIRERVRIKGEIRVLTAQQTITGYIISGLPFAVGGFLWFANNKYMREFFSNGIVGHSMVALALLLVGVGYSIVRKITDIEV